MFEIMPRAHQCIESTTFKFVQRPAQPRAYLAAGMVLAVVPIQIRRAAVIVRMNKFMDQRIVYLLLRPQVVVTDHHL